MHQNKQISVKKLCSVQNAQKKEDSSALTSDASIALTLDNFQINVTLIVKLPPIVLHSS